MSSWHTYPTIFNLGHRAVKDLLTVPHYIEEKIDGSQFSFGVFDSGDKQDGKPVYELRIRSKGCVMNVDAPEKMFSKAAESVKERFHLLHPEWTYRGEYLAKPHHNTLVYDRIPKGHIILFDVSTNEEEWLSPQDMAAEAMRIGLEYVPCLYMGGRAQPLVNYEKIRELLNTVSVLGGQKIEGIVVKQLGPQYLYGLDHKTLMGKFVSEQFKETHAGVWKEANPNKKDIIDKLIEGLATPARWAKSVQHLREAGRLENSPRDISMLIKETQADILKEEEENIKDALWNYAKGHVMRGCVRGLPEYYKELLLKEQFNDKDATECSEGTGKNEEVAQDEGVDAGDI